MLSSLVKQGCTVVFQTGGVLWAMTHTVRVQWAMKHLQLLCAVPGEHLLHAFMSRRHTSAQWSWTQRIAEQALQHLVQLDHSKQGETNPTNPIYFTRTRKPS